MRFLVAAFIFLHVDYAWSQLDHHEYEQFSIAIHDLDFKSVKDLVESENFTGEFHKVDIHRDRNGNYSHTNFYFLVNELLRQMRPYVQAGKCSEQERIARFLGDNEILYGENLKLWWTYYGSKRYKNGVHANLAEIIREGFPDAKRAGRVNDIAQKSMLKDYMSAVTFRQRVYKTYEPCDTYQWFWKAYMSTIIWNSIDIEGNSVLDWFCGRQAQIRESRGASNHGHDKRFKYEHLGSTRDFYENVVTDLYSFMNWDVNRGRYAIQFFVETAYILGAPDSTCMTEPYRRNLDRLKRSTPNQPLSDVWRISN